MNLLDGNGVLLLPSGNVGTVGVPALGALLPVDVVPVAAETLAVYCPAARTLPDNTTRDRS